MYYFYELDKCPETIKELDDLYQKYYYIKFNIIMMNNKIYIKNSNKLFLIDINSLKQINILVEINDFNTLNYIISLNYNIHYFFNDFKSKILLTSKNYIISYTSKYTSKYTILFLDNLEINEIPNLTTTPILGICSKNISVYKEI